MTEAEGQRPCRIRLADQMLFAELLGQGQLRLPVLQAAVQFDAVGELEQVEITMLIKGVKLLPVKEVAPVGQGGGHCLGGEIERVPLADDQAVFQSAVQPHAQQREKQEQQ